MPAAFQRQSVNSRGGDILRDLRLIAAKTVLEDDRKPLSILIDGQFRIAALERFLSHQISALRKRATPDASEAERPCVTSGPSKFTERSRAMKSAKSTTPWPTVAKRPSP